MGRVLPAGDTRLLQRVRLQFVLLVLVVGAIALLDLLVRIETLVSGPAYLAAVAGLLVWAVAMYRQGERSRWLDLSGPTLIACLGIAAGDQEWVFGAMYSALFLHGTYGSARRTAYNAVLYVIAYELVATITAGLDVSRVISNAIGIFAVAYLVRTIAASVRNHDENRQREQILTRTGALLLIADTADEVAHIALSAVTSILGDDGARVTLWRRHGQLLEMAALAGPSLSRSEVPLDAVPADLRDAYLAGEVIKVGPDRMAGLQRGLGLQSDFSHGLAVPLVEGETVNGLLFIATTAIIDTDTGVALERFMHEISLADVLVRRQALLAGVVDNSADGILVVGRDDVIDFASTSVTQMTGRDASTFLGQPVSALLFRRVEGCLVGVADLAEAAAAEGELYAGEDADARQVELAISPLDTESVVVNLRDVTERRRLEEEVTYRAFHDSVTGLANRALFNDRLDHALARAERDGSRLAVALIDLDDFKSVNDVHGHSAGDRMLVESAQRLNAALRRSDTCARFGGDEFAVLMEGVVDESEVAAVMDRIVGALRHPFDVEGRQVSVSASAGLRIGDGGQAGEVLVGDADVAMYVAKAKGKNQFVRFEDGMRLAALEGLELKAQLKAAIEGDQLILHYQPIVDLKSGEVTSFEALVRWQHPVKGLLAPDVFIPTAEETGLIVPLGRWVLRRACAQLAAWRAAGAVHEDTRISVNLSPHQLLTPRLVEDVAAVLDEAGVPPQQLILEVTETALMSDPERAGQVLTALTAMGIAVAIDDFGTGYSSFAYLQRFPVEVIKVDRSFIARVAEGPEQAALAHAIVKLAQTLQMATVAEGVEELAQEELLHGWGCSHGQGWRWARAMPADDAADWLADRRDADGRTRIPMDSTPPTAVTATV